MLKNKIKEIIYSDDLTDVEREDWYLGKDTDNENMYNWEEIYESRIIAMAKDIISDGEAWTLSLPLCEHSNRLSMAIIRYLKTLTNDSWTIRELDNIINS